MVVHGIHIGGTHGHEITRPVALRLLRECVEAANPPPEVMGGDDRKKAAWARISGADTLNVTSINYEYHANLNMIQ